MSIRSFFSARFTRIRVYVRDFVKKFMSGISERQDILIFRAHESAVESAPVYAQNAVGMQSVAPFEWRLMNAGLVGSHAV